MTKRQYRLIHDFDALGRLHLISEDLQKEYTRLKSLFAFMDQKKKPVFYAQYVPSPALLRAFRDDEELTLEAVFSKGTVLAEGKKEFG